MPFPGGIAASGSKAGSRYKFTIASTYEAFCPTLRDKLGEQSKVPEGVGSVMEIIINGHDLETISQATQAALAAGSTRRDWSKSRPATTAAGWARASFICGRKASLIHDPVAGVCAVPRSHAPRGNARRDALRPG